MKTIREKRLAAADLLRESENFKFLAGTSLHHVALWSWLHYLPQHFNAAQWVESEKKCDALLLSSREIKLNSVSKRLSS